MKLTTPAIASAPYTAAAPPVMTSTLRMAAGGMVLTSTTSCALTGCARRPLTSTSVRFAPRPRRSSVAAPGASAAPVKAVPALELSEEEPAGVNCGRSLRAPSTLTSERFSKFSWPTVTIGLLASKSRRTMREPVTTMRVWSLAAGVSPGVGAGVPAGSGEAPFSCAAARLAGIARAIARAPSAAAPARALRVL